MFYQIQTKFRDEIRPRFGIMRAREFTMKDAYSFHADDASLQDTYEKMYAAYSRIFERLGLDFRAVEADTGSIGGSASHEFHVLADSGEDSIAVSNGSAYAANVEKAEAVAPKHRLPTNDPIEKIATPNAHSIEEVCALLEVKAEQCLKTLLVQGTEDDTGNFSAVALVLRGDHTLNEIKAEKLPHIAAPLRFLDDEEIQAAMNAEAGSLGPYRINEKVVLMVDHAAAATQNFVCGANDNGYHLKNVCWERDLPAAENTFDLRNVVAGDASPDGQGTLELVRGIEVGHIFQLGYKYSEAMKLTCLDQNGKGFHPTMGCYGIGISRIVAAAVEQNHDARGILWPQALAPFQVGMIPIKFHKSTRLRDATEALYQKLTHAGIAVLLDDRKERPGVMFSDMDLIGIPHRLVFNEKHLDKGIIEYKARHSDEAQDIALEAIVDFLQNTLATNTQQNV